MKDVDAMVRETLRKEVEALKRDLAEARALLARWDDNAVGGGKLADDTRAFLRGDEARDAAEWCTCTPDRSTLGIEKHDRACLAKQYARDEAPSSSSVSSKPPRR